MQGRQTSPDQAAGPADPEPRGHRAGAPGPPRGPHPPRALGLSHRQNLPHSVHDESQGFTPPSGEDDDHPRGPARGGIHEAEALSEVHDWNGPSPKADQPFNVPGGARDPRDWGKGGHFGDLVQVNRQCQVGDGETQKSLHQRRVIGPDGRPRSTRPWDDFIAVITRRSVLAEQKIAQGEEEHSDAEGPVHIEEGDVQLGQPVSV